MTNSSTAGWDRISASFTPPSGSNYSAMILGNFTLNDVSATGPAAQPINPYPADVTLNGAYYYIDDALLVPFPSAGPAQVVGCGGQVQLGGCGLPANAGATYSWSPATGLDNPSLPNPTFSASTITAQPPVTYTLVVNAGGQVYQTHTTVTVVNCGPTCGTVDECNLLANGSFESGDCVPSNALPEPRDFGYQTSSGTIWGRSGCWIGYASPDRFTSQSGCTEVDYSTGNPIVNSVPYNLLNAVNQGFATPSYPQNGSIYAGIYAKAAAQSSFGYDEREYVMQRLRQPLAVGRPHYVEYYASLAPISHYTLKKLQVGFTNVPAISPNLTSAGPIMTGVSVVPTSGSLVNSVNPGWQRIGGVFMPGGNYQTIVLGNFTAGDVDTSPSGYGPGNPAQGSAAYRSSKQLDGAYYYIDNAILRPFPSAGPATQSVGCGTRFRLGECALPAGAGATYSWSPATGLNSTTSSNPTLNTNSNMQQTYTLTVTAGGQTWTSSTTVTVSCSGTPNPIGKSATSNSFSKVELHAAPTPSSDELTIAIGQLSSAASFALVEISTGRTVKTIDTVYSGDNTMNVSSVVSGVYVGHLLDGDKQTIGICRIVVLH